MRAAALTQSSKVDTAATSNSNRAFRVLYFDHTAALGGGEIALLNLVRYVDRQRITPIVVLCSEGPLADRLRQVCEVHILPLPERVRTTRKDSLGWRSLLKLPDVGAVLVCGLRLARFAIRHDVDLIHTNSLKADIIGGLAGRLARRPVIWHVRDRIESDYLPKSTMWAFRFLASFVPSYVIANSEAVLKTLRLKRHRFQSAIPSGIDLTARYRVVHDSTIVGSAPANGKGTNKQHVIALVGRICPWKGQHIFLRAAAIVHRRFPNTRFKVVGAPLFGEEEYETEIRRLCTELSLDSVVEFTGFCSSVPEMIVGLDLVVHASTTGEPFGQVIVEGMAAAKPVVATNGGGVPEIVLDNVTGFLVPMGNVPAMAEAICKVLSDPPMACRMGSQGFLRVKELFTIEKTAQKVDAVYRQILEAR
jgi:glycosyltransferase involved in cell wall biosynthesis